MNRRPHWIYVVWCVGFLFIPTFLVGFAKEAASAETTGEFLRSCELYNNKLGKVVISPGEGLQIGGCIGYFGALKEIAFKYYGSSNYPVFGVCLPDRVSTEQMMLVFISYVKQRPEILHVNSYISVLNAMTQAFPCAK